MSAPVTNRLRSATALVTGLALVLPPNLAVAQGARAEERKQFRVQCQDAGLRGPQVQPCVRAFLEGADGIAIGLEAGAGEGAADEVVEEAIEAVEAEAEVAAPKPEKTPEPVPKAAEKSGNRGRGRRDGKDDKQVVGMGDHMPGFIAKSFEERKAG